MEITQNPFYILGVTSRDNKITIITEAEKKSLFGDPEILEQARDTLTAPKKRLAAEIAWMPGVPPELQHELIAHADEKEYARQQMDKLGAGKFGPLACFNLAISSILWDRIEDAADQIVRVMEYYDKVDIEALCEAINADRAAAGIPFIEDIGLIEEELNGHADFIANSIHRKYDNFPQECYASAMTVVAKNIIDGRIELNRVCNGLFSLYELCIKDTTETKLIEMFSNMDEATNEPYGVEFYNKIKAVNKAFIEWEVLDRPLRYVSAKKGTEDLSAKVLITYIRELAMTLHTDCGQTEAAYSILDTEWQAFSRDPDINSEFAEELEKLETAMSELQKEIESKQNALAEELYVVRVKGESICIPPFCTCCMMETNNRETISGSVTEYRQKRSISASFPVCENCLAHRAALNREKALLFIISLLFSAIVSFVFSRLTMLDSTIMFYVWLAISAGAFLLAGFLLKLPSLPHGHTAREKSAVIMPVAVYGDDIEYTFTNLLYARLFIKANDVSSSKKIQYRNKVKENVLLRGVEHPIRLLFGFLVLAMCLAGILKSLTQEKYTTDYTTEKNQTEDVANAPVETDVNEIVNRILAEKPASTVPVSPSPSPLPSPSPTVDIRKMMDELHEKGALRDKLKSDLELMDHDLGIKGIRLAVYEFDTGKKSKKEKREFKELTYEYKKLQADRQKKYEEYEQAVDDFNKLLAIYNKIALQQ